MIHEDQSFHIRVQEALKESGTPQAERLVEYLLCHHIALTGEIARECSIGNVSDAACKIRPALERRGITITATRPKRLLRNVFGGLSQSHEWRLEQTR